MIDDRESLFVQRLGLIASQWPEHAAVEVDGRVIWTYTQLWEASTRIAAALHASGCGTESVVAIALPKSAEAIACVVGAWRAGAAWVPIPPELPAAQREFMLHDSGASIVISDRETPGMQVIDVHEAIANEGLLAPAVNHAIDDLAYIIYTSGTTGKPRGVAVTHRGVVPMLSQQIAATRMHDQSRSLFLLSMTFDASISDIGTVLLAGGTLCIETSLSQSGRLVATAQELLEVMNARRITYVDIPPSLLARLSPEQCPDALECVLIGGEVCPAEVVRAWAGRTRLVSVYGPTEATVCSSLTVCSPRWDRPLIGQPLRGVEYLIDGNGGEGELLITGSFLARGYVGLPQLTASRFPVINGQRCYRTGDLVRKTDDGEYLFLGRIDRQLKIRGHRIEPEQLEVALQSHPGVARAAALGRSRSGGMKSLIAFVTLVPDFAWPEPPEVTLRELIQSSMPYWMVPEVIQVLESMPVTSTDKVDYQQLSEHSLSQAHSDAGLLSPELTNLQRDLLQIYRALLSNPQLGPDDDFLLAGGDSLQVMELIAIARSQGIALSASDVAQWGSAWAIGEQLLRQKEQQAGSLEEHSAAMPAAVLRADAESLPATAASGASWHPPAQPHVLLTGGTGYLGSHVLWQLLRSSSFHVSCLVRAGDHDSACRRIRDCLNAYGLTLDESDWKRIDVVPGDVSQTRLGLSPSDYDRLGDQVSHVLHGAADINALASYESLRQANVVGTAEVARFAVAGRLKRMMAVSTLSVFVNSDRFDGTFIESDDLASTQTVFGGYAQSKWAAEWYLRCQRDLLPQLQIVRPGLLVPDKSSAAIPQRDLLTMTVRGLVKLGCVPECESHVRLDTTPITYAAAAMAYLLEHGPNDASTFHIAHPTGITANELFAAIRQWNPGIRPVSPDVFATRVNERLRASETLDPAEAMACLAVSRRITYSGSVNHPDAMDLFLATGCRFDCANTEAQLRGSGIQLPEADSDAALWIVRQIMS